MAYNDEPGHWSCVRALGAGAFGVVELWQNDYSNEMIAMKKCKGGIAQLNEKQKERWMKEVETMNSLHHPNVVATRSVPAQLRELQGKVPVLCMEYCSRGDLRTVLNQNSNCCGIEEREALRIMHDVASAVEYLHSQNLTHRDLKPENIVLQSSKKKTIYKLTDLGYVRELGEMSANASLVGTLNYLAPELLWKPTYTCSVDYWSLGILFYEIITGTRPFLPNMQLTTQWMEHVKRKKYEDICAREEKGHVSFSSEIENPSTVSDCMRQPLTTWFRIALQWDPKSRGRFIDEKGNDQLVVFTHLKSILSLKIIYVFVVSLYRIDSYAINRPISVQELQNAIREKTEIEVTEQILSDIKGNIFNEPGMSVLNSTEDSYLIVFQKDQLVVKNPPKPAMSPWTRRILDNPRCSLDQENTSRHYGASVFFVKRELELFRAYVIALSIKIDLSNIALESICEIVKNLTNAAGQLMSEITNFGQSSDYVLMSEELRLSLETTKSKTHKLIEGLNEIGSKLDTLTMDFEYLKTFSGTTWLEKWTTLYDKAENLLEMNTRGNRSQRGPPLDMAKLLYVALKLHNEQFECAAMTSFVSRIMEFDANIHQLQAPLNSFQTLVDHYRKNYDDVMRRRSAEVEENSSFALFDSMTPNDIVIYDNIVLRTLIDSLDGCYSSFDNIEDLNF